MMDQPRNNAGNSDRVTQPHLCVIGVGGAGGNAIDNMIRADLEGVEFVVANTDAQALEQSLCETQIQLGASITKGLGAGAQPEIGQAAAEEAIEAIADTLKGSNMAFITAGMGGGTGTGGAPVIARAARDEGVLTVGVVTKPFHFEGAHRMRQAESGIAELTQYVDTLIIIPNQNLFLVTDEQTTFADAFKLADEVLHSGVRGITDLMVLPGLVNLDFADVRSIMADMGKAVIGSGEAEGDNRALEAAEAAISNPLLDDVSMSGARGVLINITGGRDLMLREVDEAANRVRAEVDPDANIIFGSAFSQDLDGKIRVSVIATGNAIETKDRSMSTSGGPFVGPRTENQDTRPAAQKRAAGTIDPTAEPEEPLTLRLVRKLPANDEEQNASPATSRKPERTTGTLEADKAATVAPQSTTGRLTDPTELRFVQASGQETDNAGNQNGPASTFDPVAGPVPNQSLRTAPTPEVSTDLKAKFQRSPKPLKSESTRETFENTRANEESTEPTTKKMQYLVWEIDLGARIYKVPAEKVSSVHKQPHADRLKLFDNLDSAKAEVNAIFKRVAAQRTAKGLPKSLLESTLDDILRCEEANVPSYFL